MGFLNFARVTFCLLICLRLMSISGNFEAIAGADGTARRVFSDQALDVGMAEISLIPESELIGKSVREIGLRTRYGLNVVGLKRNGVALEGSLADEPLLLGDIILVVGNWKLIGMLAKQGRDFVALNLPEEVSEASPAHSQAPHAIFCLVLMVVLMLTDESESCCRYHRLPADGEIPLYRC